MALAYQCDECGRNWPNSRIYAKCPECEVVCRTAVSASVMTAGEARSAIRDIEFVRYCAARDRERDEAGEPQPEDIGKQEAAELAHKWRQAVTAIGELRP